MMHILHLTPYYTPAYPFGGVVRAVEGMTRALVRRGHQITVLTTDALSQTERLESPLNETIDGVQVIRQPNISRRLRGRYNLSTPQKMKQTALELLPQVDLLHVHEFRTTENLLVVPRAAERDIPILMSPHGTLNQSTGRGQLKRIWDKLLSPGIAQKIDHVISLAQSEQDDVQAIWDDFGRRRIPTTFSIIPNGVDLADFANLPDENAFRQRWNLGDARVILFMGRLHRRKGVHLLAQAFLNANLPDTKLLIVGPDEGMSDTLELLLDDRIITTGYLAGDDRLAAFAAADLMVLPAVGEGLSMAVLEAMACGLPVILSPGCNLPEAESAGAGWIVEPDIAALTGALQTAFKSDFAVMGAAAKQFIQSRFTWDAIAAELESTYQEVIATKQAAIYPDNPSQ